MFLAPFNITLYEPEITLVERGSNVTLLCEITVDEKYDMHLVSAYYRYYATPKVVEYIKYNAEMDIDAIKRTITAKLNITSVYIHPHEIYECYVRSLPADLYIDADDHFFQDARNTTLNVTPPLPAAGIDNHKCIS